MSYAAEDFNATADLYDRPHVPGYMNEKIICAALRIAAKVMQPGVIAGGMITLDLTMPTDEQFEAAIREALTTPPKASP